MADPHAVRRVLDQRPEALALRFVALRAHHPPDRGLPVPGRLGLEERPRALVRAELALVLGSELRVLPLLVGVDRGTLLRARLERSQPRRLHASLGDELPRPRDVHCAPGAPRLPRREPDRIRVRAEALADGVDPAVAERLVDRLGPRHARLAGRLLVEADPELARAVVVLGEPRAELGRRSEEDRLHAEDRRVGAWTRRRSSFRSRAARCAGIAAARALRPCSCTAVPRCPTTRAAARSSWTASSRRFATRNAARRPPVEARRTPSRRTSRTRSPSSTSSVSTGP